jgi:anti-sigma regulatory factor (Ser/Thr protein kinase)
LFDEAPGPISVYSDVDPPVEVVTVRGAWTPQLAHRVRDILTKCFAAHPAGLIIELSALGDPVAASLPTWLTAQRHGAGLYPAVPVALCASADNPLAHRLQQMNGRRFLPVYARERQARVAMADRLALPERLVLRLVATPTAVGQARDLVTRACVSWGMQQVSDSGRLVVSELVTNAIKHTGTGVSVIVSRRLAGLHIAVADGAPDRPRIPGQRGDGGRGSRADGGWGLRVVDGSAVRWGIVPTPDGKVVWATLYPEAGADRAGFVRPVSKGPVSSDPVPSDPVPSDPVSRGPVIKGPVLKGPVSNGPGLTEVGSDVVRGGD